LFTNLQPGYELESTVLSAIVFGGAVGGYFTVTTQSIHRAALVAVSGLNQSERSEAINAVLRVPWSRPASPGHSFSGKTGCLLWCSSCWPRLCFRSL
jgi:hypothetical protein